MHEKLGWCENAEASMKKNTYTLYIFHKNDYIKKSRDCLFIDIYNICIYRKYYNAISNNYFENEMSCGSPWEFAYTKTANVE